MSKRPVLHADGERGLRGGERQLLYLAAALRAQGRRQIVCARAGSALAAEAARQGFETRELPFRGEWDPWTAARLAAWARREGAIVHAHTGHAAGAILPAALTGARTVAHRRVDFPVGGPSARFKYARMGAVVAVSEAIAEILRRAGVPGALVSVVPDALPVSARECDWVGADPQRYRPASAAEKASLRRELAAQLEIDAAGPWIGNLAALVPHKDHDTLLAAAVIVLLKRPDARVLIAGEGPERARLEASIRRMGLSRKVLLLGHRPDPIPLLKSLDVYAHSSWGEGMGSVLIEAAACGVPVAATAAGGIPEVVEDDRTGLLVMPRRPEALAEAILRLISEPALAARLAAGGAARRERFGLTRMAEAMEEVYERLA